MPAMNYAQVASLYDAYVRVDFDLPFFLEETRGANRVLELTAGTGRLSIPLAGAGVELTCVDSSREMLAILKRKLAERGLSATVHELDVRTLSLAGPFDRVLLPFQSFAEILEPEDQRRVLAGVHRVLAPAGRFVVTLHNPPVRLASVDGRPVHLGDFPLPERDGGGRLFLSAVQRYDAARAVVSGAQFYEVYGPDGVLHSKRFVDVEFCLHERAAFERLTADAGFTVQALYGDYARAPFDEAASPFMIWVLERGDAIS